MNIWCRKGGGSSEYFFLLPLEGGPRHVLERQMAAFVVETKEDDTGIKLVRAGKHHKTLRPKTLMDYGYNYLFPHQVRELLRSWVQRGRGGMGRGGIEFLKAIVETRNGYLA